MVLWWDALGRAAPATTWTRNCALAPWLPGLPESPMLKQAAGRRGIGEPYGG